MKRTDDAEFRSMWLAGVIERKMAKLFDMRRCICWVHRRITWVCRRHRGQAGGTNVRTVLVRNDQLAAVPRECSLATGGAGHGPQSLKTRNQKGTGFMKTTQKGAKLRAKEGQ